MDWIGAVAADGPTYRYVLSHPRELTRGDDPASWGLGTNRRELSDGTYPTVSQSRLPAVLTRMDALVARLLCFVLSVFAHSFAAIALVGVKVTFAPNDFAIPFERQNVRRQPI